MGALAIAIACWCLLGATPAHATANLPTGFEESTLASFGYAGGTVTDVAWTPEPNRRMLLTDKSGRLLVQTESGPKLVLDISAHVNESSDRGLLSVAVDKSFATNHWVYLLYGYDSSGADDDSPQVSRLTRITLNDDNTVATPGSPETVILGKSPATVCPAPANDVDCIPADHYWHTIGTVRVDPDDGSLWVGSGDSSYSYVVNSKTFETMNPESYRGKILHIDRNGKGLPGHPFCPADSNLDHACTKVYAEGFRNPFRFALRRGKGPVVADVGMDDREEVDLIKPGANYGWPCYEGTIKNPVHDETPECQALYAKEGTAGAAQPPAWDYPHAGQGASITGGPAYDGTSNYPADYQGDVFVADYARGWIKRLDLNAAGDAVTGVSDFATYNGNVPTFVSILTMPDGNIGYVDMGWGISPWVGGFVREFRYTPANRSPVAQATGSPLAGPAPLRVTLDASGSTDPDADALTYDWDFGDGSAHSTAAKPPHTYSDTTKTYTAKVTVSDGKGGSSSATVGPITPGNTAPVPTIAAPVDGSKYRYGSSFTLSGSAADAQDGAVPNASLKWSVKQQHGNHQHALGTFTGSPATLNPGTDHDADSSLIVTLTATDSRGLTGTKTIQVYPETVPFTLASVPAGAPLSYGTSAVTAPSTRASAIGFLNTIGASQSFTKDGSTYVFDSWSDGGARQHAVAIPTSASKLTATYDGVPVAAGTATPGTGDAPLDVKFDASGSTDPDPADSLTYAWDFGDGAASAGGVRVTHRYVLPGTYTPTLTVADSHGVTATRTLPAITVAQPFALQDPATPGGPADSPSNPTQGTDPKPAKPRPLVVAMPKHGLHLSRSGVVSLKVSNPNAVAWRGSMGLSTAAKVKVGRARARAVDLGWWVVSLPAGRSSTVKMKLTGKGRRMVDQLGRVKIKAVARPAGGGAASSVAGLLLAR